ncbi:MAG TPA: YihY/virulence factor BrkB family protein [Solirubrobacteraceae bacterium]|nr:YihY/virulence factor BrkB family protein [Solirubrobacteraceae bacterium]
MSTATSVPVTRELELEGDDALETLRATGRVRLGLDAFDRFRAADGFSHARALAFQFALTLVPALIAVIGLATVLDQETFTRIVREVLLEMAPGSAGDLITEALEQGSTGGRTALLLGGVATLVAGTGAFGQLERGANRIYGVERDRPPVRKYGVAALLMVTAGAATLLAAILLVAGEALADAAGWGAAFEFLRWPVTVGLVVAALALLFELAPRRRQPEASWLVVGSGVAAVLWLLFTGVLALWIGATENFGATYGPLAGTIAVLLWTFLTALAVLLGLAFAAQLEAVRAGVTATRVMRDEN